VNTMAKRIIMSAAGVVIGAISVAVFKIAAFGVDPFQSLMSGLDQVIPISFGTLYVIVNAVLLLFSLIFDRHYIGIATFINLFLLGYITDFSYQLLQKVIVEPSIPVRVICLAVGFVVICFGASLYMTADLGVSTYDAVALICANTWKLWKFKYIRICTDLVCVIAGAALYMLGGGSWAMLPAVVGIGTIVTAFFMGPLIELFNEKISRPILAEKDAD